VNDEQKKIEIVNSIYQSITNPLDTISSALICHMIVHTLASKPPLPFPDAFISSSS
jgi:hypothetical protein